MKGFRDISDSQKFDNTEVGEIVILHGKVLKVVETNADACARLRQLNWFERFGLWLLTFSN